MHKDRTPKEVLAYAKQRGREAGRPEVRGLRRPVAAQVAPAARVRRGHVRRRTRLRRLEHPRLAQHRQQRHAAGARRAHRVDRSVLRSPDAVADLQHRRSDHARAVQPRPAPDRAEGRELPEAHRHRRHRVLGSRGRVLHPRRRALLDRHERGLLLRRLDRGQVEQRPRRGPEPRLQAALQGRLLPRLADRLAAEHPQRDGAADGGARDRRSRRTTTRWRPPARPRSTCASRRSSTWPTS